jgi:putative DNA primase/helicase
MTTTIDNHILPVAAQNIPEELTERPQWLVWKANPTRAAGTTLPGRLDKVPYSALAGRRASSTDLLTWATFEEAREALATGDYDGLGFVFSSGDPYAGVDLDDCVGEDGTIADWAKEVVRYLDSYTELSATGTGLHIIVKGEVPNRRKDKIEIYSTKRFFTVTGHVLELDGD